MATNTKWKFFFNNWLSMLYFYPIGFYLYFKHHNEKKLVSIIINCYNGEKYLSKTLESILTQKYQNFEVIFVDNCSTDSSAKIFQNIKDKKDLNIIKQKKIKLYASRNFALKKAKGEYITFLGQ